MNSFQDPQFFLQFNVGAGWAIPVSSVGNGLEVEITSAMVRLLQGDMEMLLSDENEPDRGDKIQPCEQQTWSSETAAQSGRERPHTPASVPTLLRN
jgi:hypothetical protein